jgi:capsular polysaccharide biosynthesis protein
MVLLITVGATLFLTIRQTPTYKTKATYIIRLSSEITDAKTTSTVLETLNRFPEFQGTYSEIAMSQMIKRQAGKKLGLSGSQVLSTMTVSSRTLPGSRILEISVEGEDPELIRDFTNAVGEETIAYVNDLYPSYRLTPLDPPNAPNKPISPKLPFNLVLGIVLGGFLGLVSVLLSSWLRGDLRNIPTVQNDQESTGALASLSDELQLLLRQCELIRAEFNVTRELIYHTEREARTLRATLNSWPKNGHSHGRGKKETVHQEEQNESSQLEHGSSVSKPLEALPESDSSTHEQN